MLKFENKDNGRFYYIFVEQDAEGNSVIRIVRGGKHVRVVRSLLYGSRDAVNKELVRISKKRIRRGYSLVT